MCFLRHSRTLPLAAGCLLAVAASANPFVPEPSGQHAPVVPQLTNQPSAATIAANARFTGTINGVSVYVAPTTGCILYRKEDTFRHNACLERTRHRLHDTAGGAPGD